MNPVAARISTILMVNQGLASLVGRAITKSSGENKSILGKLNSDRKHILNPLSHNDNRPVYSEELKQAMTDLEKLKKLLKN